MHLGVVSTGAVAAQVGHPLSHIPVTPVLRNELGDIVAAFARAVRALNPQRVQLASDIAEGEIRPGHDGVASLTCSKMPARFLATAETNLPQLPASPQARADSCS